VQLQLERLGHFDEQVERRRLGARLDATDGLRLHADLLGQARLREPDCLALPRDSLPKLLFDCAHPPRSVRRGALIHRVLVGDLTSEIMPMSDA
jgi:hypothetical protein